MINFFSKALLLATTILFSVNYCVMAQQKLSAKSQLPLPNHKMEDITGKKVSFNDVAQENGLLILFASNTCPGVLRQKTSILALSTFLSKNEIGMLALNSNEAFRERGDNLKEMLKYAEKVNYEFPYVVDHKNIIADEFGATHTPQVFLFDKELRLIYSGNLNGNSKNSKELPHSDLESIIESMLAGNIVEIPYVKPMGCTIKRGS